MSGSTGASAVTLPHPRSNQPRRPASDDRLGEKSLSFGGLFRLVGEEERVVILPWENDEALSIPAPPGEETLGVGGDDKPISGGVEHEQPPRIRREFDAVIERVFGSRHLRGVRISC